MNMFCSKSQALIYIIAYILLVNKEYSYIVYRPIITYILNLYQVPVFQVYHKFCTWCLSDYEYIYVRYEHILHVVLITITAVTCSRMEYLLFVCRAEISDK